MGTKMAVSSANIFMSAVETEIISLSNTKPLQWKRYIDDIFSLWSVEKKEIEDFIVLANRQHPFFFIVIFAIYKTKLTNKIHYRHKQN